jgi:transcriptional regulator
MSSSQSPPPQFYVPKFNAVEHATAAVMVAEVGVGHVITMGPHGIASSTIPLVGNHDMSKLVGHFARANPHTLEILQGMKDGQGVETLVIFSKNTGYISPAWYPSKKKNGGKEVPTWNYDLVHVRGKLRIIDDRDFVQKVLSCPVLSCPVLSCLV